MKSRKEMLLMPNTKKKTLKDWEEDLYVIYLQYEYDNVMEFSKFLNYCKGYSYIEGILGYKWKDIEENEIW